METLRHSCTYLHTLYTGRINSVCRRNTNCTYYFLCWWSRFPPIIIYRTPSESVGVGATVYRTRACLDRYYDGISKISTSRKSTKFVSYIRSADRFRSVVLANCEGCFILGAQSFAYVTSRTKTIRFLPCWTLSTPRPSAGRRRPF